MASVDVIEKMRADWDQRARDDAYYYAVFARRHQSGEEFFLTAGDTVPTLEKELPRLATRERALEIGSGPGRLMRPMSAHFGEIHGVDISPEMVALARESLKEIPHSHVHVTPKSDLSMFPADHFDYIYSYTVFQHIPSREVVLNYLRESQRTLKPGGILCCQLRGTPPLETEMQREAETWTGCTFTADDIFAFSRETGFQLVAISGAETQYLWTTWKKNVGRTFSSARLEAVTNAASDGNNVPRKGAQACVSLWIEGLSESSHLGNLEVLFGTLRQRGCYLSPLSPSGGCQLNVMLPPGLPCGRIPVSLQGAPGTHEIEVIPAVLDPKVVTVTDAINIGSRCVIDTGGLKVTLEGIEKPSEVSFRIGDRWAEIVQTELKDPVLLKYEYSFYLPDRKLKGNAEVQIRVSERDLEPIAIDIV